MAGTNTLAKYDTVIITAVKSFKAQAAVIKTFNAVIVAVS
jgi:hypothetical protein